MHLIVNLLCHRGVSAIGLAQARANYYWRYCYHELPLKLFIDAFARRSSHLDMLPGVVAVHAAHRHQPAFPHFAPASQLVHAFT